MPIYEYRCTDCAHQLEKLQKLSDPPLTDCPSCGQATLTKLVSAASFRLKGGGWYETDFKKDGQRNLAGDGDAKDKTQSEGKSDSSDSSGAGAKSTESGGSKGDAAKSDSAKGDSKKSDSQKSGSASSSSGTNQGGKSEKTSGKAA